MGSVRSGGPGRWLVALVVLVLLLVLVLALAPAVAARARRVVVVLAATITAVDCVAASRSRACVSSVNFVPLCSASQICCSTAR